MKYLISKANEVRGCVLSSEDLGYFTSCLVFPSDRKAFVGNDEVILVFLGLTLVLTVDVDSRVCCGSTMLFWFRGGVGDITSYRLSEPIEHAEDSGVLSLLTNVEKRRVRIGRRCSECWNLAIEKFHGDVAKDIVKVHTEVACWLIDVEEAATLWRDDECGIFRNDFGIIVDER